MLRSRSSAAAHLSASILCWITSRVLLGSASTPPASEATCLLEPATEGNDDVFTDENPEDPIAFIQVAFDQNVQHGKVEFMSEAINARTSNNSTGAQARPEKLVQQQKVHAMHEDLANRSKVIRLTSKVMPIQDEENEGSVLGTSSTTDLSGSIFVMAAFLIGVVSIVLLSTGTVAKDDVVMVPIVLLFIQHLTYTLIIPSSYDMSLACGLGVAYSGFLIGFSMFGVMIGSVSMWFSFKIYGNLWRRGRDLCLASAVLNLVGALAYSNLSFISSQRLEKHHLPSYPMYGFGAALAASRILDGIGTGINVQYSLVAITRVIESNERPAWMTTNQFGVMMGIGLGPILASAVTATVTSGNIHAQNLNVVGVAYVGIALTALAVVYARFPPSMDGIEDCTPAENPVPEGSTGDPKQERGVTPGSKIIIITSGLLMGGIRGFVISGLEAATSLLLETEYGWTCKGVGVAIGVCFLFCIPVKTFHGAVKDMLKITTWIRLLAYYSILGSILLFTFACVGGQCDLMVLIGDAVLFPGLFLGDALSTGLMMMEEHVFQKGSWGDANHILLYRNLLVAGVGRNLGPPLARIQVEAGGQNSYAFQQLAMAGLFLVIYEAFMLPNVAGDSLGAQKTHGK